MLIFSDSWESILCCNWCLLAWRMKNEVNIYLSLQTIFNFILHSVLILTSSQTIYKKNHAPADWNCFLNISCWVISYQQSAGRGDMCKKLSVLRRCSMMFWLHQTHWHHCSLHSFNTTQAQFIHYTFTTTNILTLTHTCNSLSKRLSYLWFENYWPQMTETYPSLHLYSVHLTSKCQNC